MLEDSLRHYDTRGRPLAFTPMCTPTPPPTKRWDTGHVHVLVFTGDRWKEVLEAKKMLNKLTENR